MKPLRWLSYGVLVAAGLNYLRVRSIWTSILFIPRVFASAFSPFVALVAGLTVVAGWRVKDWRTVFAGGLGAGLALHYVRRVIAPHQAFEAAFGDDWRARIAPQQQSTMLRRRWHWLLREQTIQPQVARDVVYATLTDHDRQLLCDVWQPAASVPRSGLGIIYLHGSAWHYGDKGLEATGIVHHLTAQGHVVVDLAYRLAPETDLVGMVADVRRAINWLATNAARYQLNPERIVLLGGSAGAHLALLTAYSRGSEQLIVDGSDPAGPVRGVVSLYGPVDMRAVFANGKRFYERNHTVVAVLEKVYKRLGIMKPGSNLTSPDTMMLNLVGCLPDENPEAYQLVSPLYHVGVHCPPTLLIQGAADWLVPAEHVRELHQALRQAGVQSVYVELPHTDHGFDLFEPRFSPAAHAALYDIERFLALLI